jgi:hypothetical protein
MFPLSYSDFNKTTETYCKKIKLRDIMLHENSFTNSLAVHCLLVDTQTDGIRKHDLCKAAVRFSKFRLCIFSEVMIHIFS